MPTRTSAFRARKLDWKSFVLGDFFRTARKFELFEAVPALNECMKPIDSLERDLSKLASADWSGSEFESFCSGVWREIPKCYRAGEKLRIFLAKNQNA
jgi:hypothetical protein